MGYRLIRLILSIAFLYPLPLLAQWHSATHVGYAVLDHSSTELENARGSVLFFDFTRTLFNRTSVGIRTTAIGGQTQPSRRYYRLGTGPIVDFCFWKSWYSQLSYSYFNESAQTNDQTTYTSNGHSLLVSWEKRLQLTDYLVFGWGGFWGRHWAQFDNKDPSVAKKTTMNARYNIGNLRGLSFSVRMIL